MRNLQQLGRDLDLAPDDLIPFGSDKAKIALPAVHRPGRKGKLILMTAMSPCQAGEGKTTVAIGLADALRRLGQRSVVALRQPSMGPVFGKKGGGSGGGLAQVIPAESINLHFNGDLHAITQAHNLLASAVDNSLHFGNPLGIDSRAISWPRVLDLNERCLRQVVVGLGGRLGGVPREGAFVITAASEVMAILALARDWSDLRQRLGSVVVGSSLDGQSITAESLKVAGAMAALLRDALQPNLVQTLEGTPALVHCGPFANIAHGTSSLVGTLAGLRGADFVIQEAGFGADLGGEKFLDLFCPQLGQGPALAILVLTLPGVAYHGLQNTLNQIRRMQRFGLSVVACLNARGDDNPEERKQVLDGLRQAGHVAFLADVFGQGGAGALELADYVRDAGGPGEIRTAYGPEHTLREKISRVALDVYGASAVHYSRSAEAQLQAWEKVNLNPRYVCVAKTQYSLGDDPKVQGVPEHFDITVRELQWRAGAGFVVPVAGDMMIMPALPSKPNFESIELLPDGQIVGLH